MWGKLGFFAWGLKTCGEVGISGADGNSVCRSRRTGIKWGRKCTREEQGDGCNKERSRLVLRREFLGVWMEVKKRKVFDILI